MGQSSCQRQPPPDVPLGDATGVAPGQVAGKVTGWLTQPIAAAYCVTPGGLAADQITDEQVLASQPPPKVKEGPVSTIWHWQVAKAGSRGSSSQGISRQLAQGISSGQVSAPKALVTFSVENVETTALPAGARSLQVVKPME